MTRPEIDDKTLLAAALAGLLPDDPPDIAADRLQRSGFGGGPHPRPSSPDRGATRASGGRVRGRADTLNAATISIKTNS